MPHMDSLTTNFLGCSCNSDHTPIFKRIVNLPLCKFKLCTENEVVAVSHNQWSCFEWRGYFTRSAAYTYTNGGLQRSDTCCKPSLDTA